MSSTTYSSLIYTKEAANKAIKKTYINTKDRQFVDLDGLGDQINFAKQVLIFFIKIFFGQRDSLVGIVLKFLVGIFDQSVDIHSFSESLFETRFSITWSRQQRRVSDVKGKVLFSVGEKLEHFFTLSWVHDVLGYNNFRISLDQDCLKSLYICVDHS